MGVQPYLIASSLVGAVAQRLVRVLCKQCKLLKSADGAECELLGVDINDPPSIYHPVGCAKCNDTGFRGRTGIYEIIEIDDHVRTLIHEKASETKLEHYVRGNSQTMQQDGFRAVLTGITSLEEVLRVTTEK